ncbi:MAG: amino acid-binding protein [Actinomycetia bacterium]|nr:amino acid-binding protein [Actinomycetes bacterium]
MKQVSVFLENSPGRLAEATRILGDAGHNMHALTVADTSDFGVARIIVDNPEQAAAELKKRGISAQVHDVCAVAITDEPGQLSELLDIIAGQDFDISYCYCFVHPVTSSAVNVFRLNSPEVIPFIRDAGYRVLELEDLHA